MFPYWWNQSPRFVATSLMWEITARGGSSWNASKQGQKRKEGNFNTMPHSANTSEHLAITTSPVIASLWKLIAILILFFHWQILTSLRDVWWEMCGRSADQPVPWKLQGGGFSLKRRQHLVGHDVDMLISWYQQLWCLEKWAAAQIRRWAAFLWRSRTEVMAAWFPRRQRIAEEAKSCWDMLSADRNVEGTITVNMFVCLQD